MKLLSVVALLTLVTAGLGFGAIVDVVVNGEFEDPTVTANGGLWEHFPNATVPGWTSTTDTVIEFWSQGAIGSPANGSDTNPTGQHMEINANDGVDTITQSIVLPTLLTTGATLNFDAWLRGVATGTYSISGSISGALVTDAAVNMNGSAWTLNSASGFNVESGETITLSFTSTAAGPNSTHIDGVSFLVDQDPGGGPAIPEPGTYLLVGAGLAGLAYIRRKRVAG